MRPIIHAILHFLVPAIVARWGFPERWVRAWVIMCCTMVIDLDHLLADPIYDPDRCSVGFHPLHTNIAIVFYLILCIFPKTRIAGLGLVIHIVLDFIDCIWMKW